MLSNISKQQKWTCMNPDLTKHQWIVFPTWENVYRAIGRPGNSEGLLKGIRIRNCRVQECLGVWGMFPPCIPYVGVGSTQQERTRTPCLWACLGAQLAGPACGPGPWAWLVDRGSWARESGFWAWLVGPGS